MLLLLPACHLPALCQPEPSPPLPDSFKANGAISSSEISLENSAQVCADDFYADPLLIRLIQQGLDGNRELKVLDQEVQIARNEVLARRGAYLPFVSLGASGGLERPSRYTPMGAVERQLEYAPGRHFPDPLPNTQFGLNFFWQLDIWRQLRNARDAAEQRFIATAERRNYFATQLIAEIAENYYGLMALDKRLETLDNTIKLQEKSRDISKAKMEAGRGTELPVQRFEAEVRKNRSEKLVVAQEIVEVENRINYRINRFPEHVERATSEFFDLNLRALSLGVPSQLLQNRADIRRAERELVAAGLDVQVARARFYPSVTINANVGLESFNPAYLFTNPAQALVAGVTGGLVQPLINKKAIQAEYLSANARQLEAVYNYQRVVLNAFTEVVNRVSMVENYRKSIELKKQQLESLEASVDSATKLFTNARVEYIEVLFAQRDLQDAKVGLIETKRQQLSAVVNAYQALGGGLALIASPTPLQPLQP